MSAKKKFLREPERLERTGIVPTTWKRWEQSGHAPKRRKLGPRMIGWVREEIEKWEQERAQS